MDREVQAFEDTVNSLTSALRYAGQALSEAATAVALVMSAEQEASEARQEQEVVKPDAPRVLSGQYPHFVSIRLWRCSSKENAGKSICQLRRADTDEWLWSSHPYKDAGRAIRDASNTAHRFGWEVVSQSGATGSDGPEEVLDPDDGQSDYQRGFEAGQCTSGAAKKATPPPNKRYVVGFRFSGDLQSVVLILKTHPEWQAGRYNGVGGHIEDGETPEQTMKREYLEETGTTEANWKLFNTLYGKDGNFSVDFFWARGPLTLLRSTTEETVHWLDVDAVVTGKLPTLPSLGWMIPMAITDIRRTDVCTRFVTHEEEYVGDPHD